MMECRMIRSAENTSADSPQGTSGLFEDKKMKNTQKIYRSIISAAAAALFLFTAAGTGILFAEESRTGYRLISQRTSGDGDLVEKTFDAAGNLLLEMDPQTQQNVSVPKTEENGGETAKETSEENKTEKDTPRTVIQKIPMKVTSRQKYEEIFIQEGNLLPGERAKSTLGAWHFLENDTLIKIEETAMKQELDLAQPLFGVDIKDSHIHIFRPDGFLTRNELDTVNIQGNTLLVDYILPNRTNVQIGESWKQSPDTMGMLLQMDLVFNLDIQTTLTDVQKNIAILETSGWLEGSYEGNTSKLEVKGKSYFDLKRGRIVWFGLVIEEKRTAGYVTPGMDVTAKVQYKITPLTESKNLTDATVGKIAFDEAQYGLLLFEDPGKAWRVVLTPEWEPMNHNKYQSNFRLVSNGELVAQCSIASIRDTRSTLDLKPEEYTAKVREMLKDQFESILDVKSMQRDDNTEITRVDVAAKYEDMDLRMYYYLLTRKGESPRQCTVVFTLEENLVEKFGETNEELIQSFTWGD